MGDKYLHSEKRAVAATIRSALCVMNIVFLSYFGFPMKSIFSKH